MSGLDGSEVNDCQWQSEPTTAPPAGGQVPSLAPRKADTPNGVSAFLIERDLNPKRACTKTKDTKKGVFFLLFKTISYFIAFKVKSKQRRLI